MSVPRSLLFVPGDRPDRFDKAVASGADLVVLDLEDAVRPEAKDAARRNVREWLEAGGRAAVRVNGISTQWHGDDLAVLQVPGAVAAMLPKAEEAAALDRFGASLPTGVAVIALIETALGVWNAREIASAARVDRLAFGSVDFQLDCDAEDSRDALLHARSRLVLASTIAGIAPPVDGVTVKLDDEARLEADVEHARSLGFRGKLCIHPAQVARVNSGFRPSQEMLNRARRIVEAAERQDAGSLRLDGELIDLPVITRARRMLELPH